MYNRYTYASEPVRPTILKPNSLTIKESPKKSCRTVALSFIDWIPVSTSRLEILYGSEKILVANRNVVLADAAIIRKVYTVLRSQC